MRSAMPKRCKSGMSRARAPNARVSWATGTSQKVRVMGAFRKEVSRSGVNQEARAAMHQHRKRSVKGGEGKKKKRSVSGGQKQRTIQVLVACSWQTSEHHAQGCEK